MLSNVFKNSKLAAVAALGVGVMCGALGAQNGQMSIKGPSSSQPPYVVGVDKGVISVAILTVGDSVNLSPNGQPYRFVGIPDGLGILDLEGDIGIYCNHELSANTGAPRRHSTNGAGAFVSKWTVRGLGTTQKSFEVVGGEDLIAQTAIWNRSTGAYNAPATGVVFDRFCSADLPPKSAFRAGNLGYNGRLFLNGEETNEGRAFAHVATGPLRGTSYELPWFGRASWENVVAHPLPAQKTIVVALDDSTPGQVYVYAGQKQSTGTPADQAGLNYGVLYGIKVLGVPAEDRAVGVPMPTAFECAALPDQTNQNAASLNAVSDSLGVTRFLRPEDGAWNPINPNEFFFVTTDRFDTTKTGTGPQIGRSRLYRLTFFNYLQPELGGMIDMLLDGTEAIQMMDNMCFDRAGNVLIQEDPGNQAYSARTWHFDVATDTLTEVARFDPFRFGDLNAPAVLPFSQDEESSGIVDATDTLGSGWFFYSVQAHYNLADPELVQGGQLGAIYIPRCDLDGSLDLNVRTLFGQ